MVRASTPERRQASCKGARRDRAAVSGQDAGGEAIPQIPALEEQVRRCRGDRCKHPRLLVTRVEDGHELAREKRESLDGERRKRRHGALPQEQRFAEDPVEECAFELLHRAGETPEGAGGVHPHERLRMKQERLQHLERLPDELGIGVLRHAAHADLEAPRGEHASTQGAARGCPDHRIERFARAPKPFPEMRDLKGARPRLPDQDLQTNACLRILRQRQLRAAAEEWRTCERVEQRSLDDAITRHGRHPLAEGCVRGTDGEELGHLHVAPPGARRAPHEHDLTGVLREEVAEGTDVSLHRRPRQRAAEQIRGSAQLARELGLVLLVHPLATACAPSIAHLVRKRGVGGQGHRQCRERGLGLFGEH